MKAEKTIHDRVRGCLVGGAAGDALGYPVEFMSESQIRSRFGSNGITSFVLDEESGKALISDDSQMTLFTANGLLFGATRGFFRGVGADPSCYVSMAYHDWLWTQEHPFGTKPEKKVSWLLDVPELYSGRAPGTTCLSALKTRKWGGADRYIDNPINNSKGCGGIMRVAPIGMLTAYPAQQAAEAAAYTHGHPLGYIPAALLSQMIHEIIYNELGLKEALTKALDEVVMLFDGNQYLGDLLSIIYKAVDLSLNDKPDSENIKELGEGWVAEETLAIALYCCLRHSDSFSDAIIAAVNHDGDSDSTGSVTGNILGAYLGFNAIDEKWKKNLELKDVILEIADDLSNQHPFPDDYTCPEDWEKKYIFCQRT